MKGHHPPRGRHGGGPGMHDKDGEGPY